MDLRQFRLALLGKRARAIGSFLRSLVWRLALLFLAGYGLAHVVVRTEWFRARVERVLSQMTGMEMRVGRIQVTESLNLKIRHVISISEDAGVELRLVRVRWRFLRPRGAPLIESVRVDGWAMTFAPDTTGVMQPAFMGQVPRKTLGWSGLDLGPSSPKADSESLAPTGRLADWMTSAIRGGIPQLEMRWGTLRLQDAQGRLQADVAGLDVLVTTMVLPEGDRITHYDVRAATVQVIQGPRIVGLHAEMIDTGERQFLSVLEATDWGAAPRPRAIGAEYRELLDAMD